MKTIEELNKQYDLERRMIPAYCDPEIHHTSFMINFGSMMFSDALVKLDLYWPVYEKLNSPLFVRPCCQTLETAPEKTVLLSFRKCKNGDNMAFLLVKFHDTTPDGWPLCRIIGGRFECWDFGLQGTKLQRMDPKTDVYNLEISAKGRDFS